MNNTDLKHRALSLASAAVRYDQACEDDARELLRHLVGALDEAEGRAQVLSNTVTATRIKLEKLQRDTTLLESMLHDEQVRPIETVIDIAHNQGVQIQGLLWGLRNDR